MKLTLTIVYTINFHNIILWSTLIIDATRTRRLPTCHPWKTIPSAVPMTTMPMSTISQISQEGKSYTRALGKTLAYSKDLRHSDEIVMTISFII